MSSTFTTGSTKTKVGTPRATPTKNGTAETIAITPPKKNLSSLQRLQNVEDSKPKLSKISWLADVLVYQSSIIPIVAGPVIMLALFAAAVAAASIVFGKQVALTNNVVPLLSVVVGLLLVFRNSTAYERYAEGRKDFTALISNARNLTRSIWINVVPPPTGDCDRAELTRRKKELIRLVVGFVFATKHYLRSEGGANHADMKGLLPRSLFEFARQGTTDGSDEDATAAEGDGVSDYGGSACSSPRSYSGNLDEESAVGVSIGARSRRPSKTPAAAEWLTAKSKITKRPRRPTAVRVSMAEVEALRENSTSSATSAHKSVSATSLTERTPLIKAGVKPDIRRTLRDVEASTVGFGRMVEVGLPLVIAHEISRSIFRFRKQGNLEVIGPAGFNAMTSLVQAMTDQLGSMERIIQTPLPYVFCVHLKQCVTLYLLCLPFVLVETMGWKMIWIVMCTAFTLCGVEGIAAQIEQPFGTDPCDLNLDLFCTELLCECEALVERLPEGDEDDDIVYQRPIAQILQDEEDGE